jgi:hypothetical protein
MTPNDKLEVLLVMRLLGERGPSSVETLKRALPPARHRYTEGRLLQARREAWVTVAGKTRRGERLWCLTPAGVAWLDVHDPLPIEADAADAAE